MMQRYFSPLAFLALLSLATVLPAQQPQRGGAISAQQVMSTLAGMRSDLDAAIARDKQLSTRLESLEEELSRKNTELQNLRALCQTLAQQNQNLENRMNELQSGVEADQSARREEWRKLTNDITGMVRNAPAANVPDVPTVDFKIAAGDTLSSIAKAAKCTVREIMALNPSLKSADDIRVGQVLRIPRK